MRVSLFAQAITAAALWQRTVAAPTPPKPLTPTSPRLAEGTPAVDFKHVQFQPTDVYDEERTKYFHEPGGDEELSHYDSRYFHGVVSDEERTDTQSHMIKAYLDFFRKEHLDTWLAHGTLLGWWWNGKRFPWDVDLDTQVSNSTLKRLGEKYNQTRHYYTSQDGNVKREYLLDVNAWIGERVRGDGMNVIDARWIDIRNGLYIDITGLAETQPQNAPGVWSCKNYHRYQVTDLYPLRTTVFEGVEAKVPYEYDKILTEEYTPSALVRTEFNGHIWDAQQRLWVKSAETLRREKMMKEWKEEQARNKEEERKKLDALQKLQ